MMTMPSMERLNISMLILSGILYAVGIIIILTTIIKNADLLPAFFIKIY